jgi:hypothetical protein
MVKLVGRFTDKLILNLAIEARMRLLVSIALTALVISL